MVRGKRNPQGSYRLKNIEKDLQYDK